MDKYRCKKNWYIMGMLAFTKGNEYKVKSYLDGNPVIRSDLYRPKIAIPPILVSSSDLSEYFEKL